jgi:hypothetical protein
MQYFPDLATWFAGVQGNWEETKAAAAPASEEEPAAQPAQDPAAADAAAPADAAAKFPPAQKFLPDTARFALWCRSARTDGAADGRCQVSPGRHKHE